MPTLAASTPPTPPPAPTGDAAYRHPELAQAFGSDAEKYDRVRPRYPAALVDAVVERLPGRAILDVGIGTGISAEPFRERGFELLGIEPDPRMAAVARAKDLVVEDGRFEDWDPAGRTFDGVIAGQTWHWIDPVAGTAKAAGVLRPGGRLALFWNTVVPAPEVATVFADIFESLETGLPFNPWTVAPAADPYGAIIDRTADGLRATGAFGAVERLTFEWQSTTGRDAWLEVTSTAGGINRLPSDKLELLLRRMGAAIDAAGGSLVVGCTTVAAIAERMPD
ncbi:class I SAM-dependent methyltransferase [Microlunatus ginsengisoli]|uniref:Class I SAM-dependent methyltransferase n=1 Tax=Microlunatus ginsengisoli TaxID=363863 RepID=A0ABP6ZJC7_9ACTN